MKAFRVKCIKRSRLSRDDDHEATARGLKALLNHGDQLKTLDLQSLMDPNVNAYYSREEVVGVRSFTRLETLGLARFIAPSALHLSDFFEPLSSTLKRVDLHLIFMTGLSTWRDLVEPMRDHDWPQLERFRLLHCVEGHLCTEDFVDVSAYLARRQDHYI